jgi:hypothetical protein
MHVQASASSSVPVKPLRVCYNGGQRKGFNMKIALAYVEKQSNMMTNSTSHALKGSFRNENIINYQSKTK